MPISPFRLLHYAMKCHGKPESESAIPAAELSPTADGFDTTGNSVSPSSPGALPTGEARPAPRKVAVLLIDAEYHDSIWVPGSYNDDLPSEKKAMADVLARANAAQAPVFEIVMPGLYKTDSSLAALRGDNWVGIEKCQEDAFDGTKLLAELRARGITDVVLLGTNQDACVLETAYSAQDAGLRVHTSPQLVQGNPASAFPTATYQQLGEVADDYRSLPILEALTEQPKPSKRDELTVGDLLRRGLRVVP